MIDYKEKQYKDWFNKSRVILNEGNESLEEQGKIQMCCSG